MQVLDRVCVPPPHDSVQALQAENSEYPPFTGSTTVRVFEPVKHEIGMGQALKFGTALHVILNSLIQAWYVFIFGNWNKIHSKLFRKAMLWSDVLELF